MAISDTVDTTRLCYDSPVELSTAVSRMLWPLPSADPSAPQVIILAPANHFSYPIMAASLIHDPIMGALLINPPSELTEEIAAEITRLSPAGTEQLPAAIMVGPFRQRTITAVENLGYGVLNITGRDPFTTAVNVARLREEIPPESTDGPLSVMVVGAESPFEGMLAAYYSAHSGVPVLLTKRDRLPSATARFLRERPDKTVYVIGGRRSVSETVFREIGTIVEPPVTRIAGANVFETAVEFSRFHDQTTGFGWNRTRPAGDAFTFSNIDRWNLALAATNFAHQGKHTPLLPLRQDLLPDAINNYLTDLKPPLKTPPRPPFMHGFILGTEDDITTHNQAVLELALKIDTQHSAEMDMEE